MEFFAFTIISLVCALVVYCCGCATGYAHRRNRNSDLSHKYYELLFAVHRKFKGESRHDTALRYIIEAEDGRTITTAAATMSATVSTK